MAGTVLEQTLARHRAFWECGKADRPIVFAEKYQPLSEVKLMLADGSAVKQDMYLTPELLDPKRMLDMEEAPKPPRAKRDSPGGINGDVFVIRPPITKMPWVEAVLGCKVQVQVAAGSIYSQPFLESAEELSRIPPTKGNAWLKKLQEYTRVLVQNANGRYHVPLSLMRGTVDLVAALLGYNRMAEGIVDNPRAIRKLTERSIEAFMAVAEAQFAETPMLEGGRVTPYGVWAPGTFIKSQCDASAALSAKTYEEMFFPYELEIYKRYKYSNVHLHSGYLHTVPTFLKTDWPTSLQVALDTGSTPQTVGTLMPVFKQITAKKPLFITGPMTRAELDLLQRELPPGGLMIGAYLTD